MSPQGIITALIDNKILNGQGLALLTIGLLGGIVSLLGFQSYIGGEDDKPNKYEALIMVVEEVLSKVSATDQIIQTDAGQDERLSSLEKTTTKNTQVGTVNSQAIETGDKERGRIIDTMNRHQEFHMGSKPLIPGWPE